MPDADLRIEKLSGRVQVSFDVEWLRQLADQNNLSGARLLAAFNEYGVGDWGGSDGPVDNPARLIPDLIEVLRSA